MKTNFNLSIVQKATSLFIVTMFVVISASALTPLTFENQVTIITEMLKSGNSGSLTARVTEKSVYLDWNTSSELNNNYFEVERSVDMNHFKTVAIVLDGFTTTGNGKRYAFKEDIIVVKNNKTAYYRLKQFDVYGNTSYSEVVRVQP